MGKVARPMLMTMLSRWAVTIWSAKTMMLLAVFSVLMKPHVLTGGLAPYGHQHGSMISAGYSREAHDRLIKSSSPPQQGRCSRQLLCNP